MICFLATRFARIDWFMVRNAVGVAWKARACERMESVLGGTTGRVSGEARNGALRARARSEASIGRLVAAECGHGLQVAEVPFVWWHALQPNN